MQDSHKSLMKVGILLVIGLFSVLFSSSFVNAVILNNILQNFNFDNNFIDNSGHYNGTNSSVIFTNNGLIYQALNLTGISGKSVDLSVNILKNTNDNYTINFWMKSTNSARNMVYGSQQDEGNFMQIQFNWNRGNNIPSVCMDLRYSYTFSNNCDSEELLGANYSTLNNGSFHMITYVFDKSSTIGLIYIDGTLQKNSSITAQRFPNVISWIGQARDYSYNPFNGTLDEFSIWNRSLTKNEVEFLYNYGKGLPYPFPTTLVLFNITAYDTFNNSIKLYNLSAYINGSLYSTSSGLLSTYLNGTYYYNITLMSDDNVGYFNKTFLDYNINNNLNASLYQTEIIVIAKEKSTNETISGTLKINGITNTSSSLFLRANTPYNLSFSNTTSYLNNKIDYNATLPALFNGTVLISGFYDTILNITLKDKLTNVSILNFSGYVNLTGNTSFSEKFNITNSSGLARINLVKGINYTVYIQENNYSIGTDNFKTVNITNNNTLINFLLYQANSVFVYIYDISTSQLLNINETIQLITTNTTSSYSTINGTYTFLQLPSAVYTFRFSSPSNSYLITYFIVTVGNSNTQILNVSLQNTTYSSVLAFVDSGTQNPLINVSINVYQQTANNTYVLTQSGLTDITGRFAVYYAPFIQYLFQANLINYVPLTFYLNPILYSSYTISMISNRSNNYTGRYSNVYVYYFPRNFKIGLNNLTMLFQSTSGSLVNYGYNLSYPTGTFNQSGNNANGETLTTTNFNISTSDFADTVNITYWYTTTIEGYNTKTDVYYINGISANNTFITNQDNHYGLGNLELVLIITVITILIVGIVSFAVGSLFGIAIGIFMWFYFSYIGLLPIWLIIVPALIGFFIIIIRGSNQ